jgi:hypothetical protein
MPAVGTLWPAQADYIEALQDPAGAFIDPALRAGTVEVDSVLGLPKPRSGQMASVYKVFDGTKTWAVRCFNFALAERAARYGAISDFLARSPNRYTVEFAYLPDGIVVASTTYPIVKMEWVEGDLLHTYIARHLDSPFLLQRLARAWVEMARDLHALGLAHGDLQHGNVLVTAAGELKLIDYDGMFVPAFTGMGSLEDGHPNYQHPCRQARNFGAQLDNFSVWSVYLSIVAVARDRTAWETFGFGDDCLALRRADYVRPSASPAFAALGAAADADVRKMGEFVRSLLTHEPEGLPALESCSRVVAAPVGGTQLQEWSWRFAPFEIEPLAPGVYAEPFEAPAVEPRAAPLPPPAPPGPGRRLVAAAGGGIAATVGGYWVFHALGFATEQFVAVVVLGWVLAGILAVASRSPQPPTLPPAG